MTAAMFISVSTKLGIPHQVTETSGKLTKNFKFNSAVKKSKKHHLSVQNVFAYNGDGVYAVR